MKRLPSLSIGALSSPRGLVLSRAGAFAFAVARERREIARDRPRRVQRVDARTGAPPSLRQTIVVLGAQRAIRWLLDRAIPKPGQTRAERFRDELARAHAEHAHDPDGRQEAIVRLYGEQGVQPTSACLPILLRSVAITLVVRAPVPFVAERRTLPDLLAGTKLVRSGPSRWERLPRRGAAR